MEDHKHEDGFKCEACENGIDAMLAKEAQMLKDHGWFVHFVPDPKYPFGMNVHTHGLSDNFGHMDLQICLDMSPRTCHSILINAVESIKAGKKFESGKTYDELIQPTDKKFEVLFLQAVECDRPVLRLIFPDKEGKFDGELSDQKLGCELGRETVEHK